VRFSSYPKYKPTGVGWVCEIPEHWEAGNLRRFAQMKTGHTPSRNEPEYWDDCDIPWFTLADVWQLRDGRQTYLGDTKEKISRLGLMNSAAELLPAGTVVFPVQHPSVSQVSCPFP
jgi:type I restriction enzyme S subunit